PVESTTTLGRAFAVSFAWAYAAPVNEARHKAPAINHLLLFMLSPVLSMDSNVGEKEIPGDAIPEKWGGAVPRHDDCVCSLRNLILSLPGRRAVSALLIFGRICIIVYDYTNGSMSGFP